MKLTTIREQLHGIYQEVQQKNNQVFEILDDIEQGIDTFLRD